MYTLRADKLREWCPSLIIEIPPHVGEVVVIGSSNCDRSHLSGFQASSSDLLPLDLTSQSHDGVSRLQLSKCSCWACLESSWSSVVALGDMWDDLPVEPKFGDWSSRPIISELFFLMNFRIILDYNRDMVLLCKKLSVIVFPGVSSIS